MEYNSTKMNNTLRKDFCSSSNFMGRWIQLQQCEVWFDLVIRYCFFTFAKFQKRFLVPLKKDIEKVKLLQSKIYSYSRMIRNVRFNPFSPVMLWEINIKKKTYKKSYFKRSFLKN